MKQNSHQQFTELFKNRIETRIIKTFFKNERVCMDIYIYIKTEKSTGTRWLWQQDGFGNKIKYHFHITTIHKYFFFVFCLYSSYIYLCTVVMLKWCLMWKWYLILLPKPSCSCAFFGFDIYPYILSHFNNFFYYSLSYRY